MALPIWNMEAVGCRFLSTHVYEQAVSRVLSKCDHLSWPEVASRL